MRHDTGIYRLVVYDLIGVEVLLDVQSLEKFETLLICDFCFCL